MPLTVLIKDTHTHTQTHTCMHTHSIPYLCVSEQLLCMGCMLIFNDWHYSEVCTHCLKVREGLGRRVGEAIIGGGARVDGVMQQDGHDSYTCTHTHTDTVTN